MSRAMSRDDVELVRCLYEAFNRRDYANAVQCLDPQVEVYPAVVGLDPAGAGTTRRWVGRHGVLRTFQDLGETWHSVTVEIQGIEELADGRVLAVEDWHTRGRDGIGFTTRITDVYTVERGLIVRVDGFLDKAKALEAVGLR